MADHPESGRGMDAVARMLAVIKEQTDLIATDSLLPELMTLIAQNAQNLTGSQAGMVELVEGDELVVAAATGAAEAELGARTPIETTLSGLAVRTQQVQVCDDADDDTRVEPASAQLLHARSIVAIPLFHRLEPVGVLAVGAAQPSHFAPTQVQLLQVMAGFVASAISQARRFDDAARSALRDPLTGLVTQAFLLESLGTALARRGREGGSVGVVVADLDGFRRVNDTHGYVVGDSALLEVGRRLRRAVRSGDVVARIGGNAFAVVCEHRDLVSTTHLARRLARQITMPIQTTGGWVDVGVSIGAAVAVEGEGARQLMARADTAMYRTKRSKQRGIDVHNVSISGGGAPAPG